MAAKFREDDRPSLPSTALLSVNGPQDTLCFWVLQHVLLQPVILPGASLSELMITSEKIPE
ncbi:hypothetical protein [Nitrosomonas communis]|uniref:hypothetical protein n=1 Tax=Nitrosomonas communis TaxID=44574 RepID=UPI0026ECDE7C|nr:hypothetical protein [Nitrosomonas communis]